MRIHLASALAVAAASLRPSFAAASRGPSAPTSRLVRRARRAFLLAPRGGDGGLEFHESQPLSQTPVLDGVLDAPLIADIEMLSNMLAHVVKKENPTVYDLYTRFRELGMERAANPDDAEQPGFDEMKLLARDISPQDALGVMKTFSIALNLVNAAEVHHRMRLVRESDCWDEDAGEAEDGSSEGDTSPLPRVEDSIRGTMEILRAEGHEPDAIFDQLIAQQCEIVLTAHPTEVNRKTVLVKCE